MDCEVLAIGTELLLGQVVDTNSAWIGERFADVGISCYYQAKVGDNQGRIVSALQAALSRADAVVCCGGLGPTQDDVTREAIAEVMGVALVRSPEIGSRLRERFAGREIPQSNYRQADVPEGAMTIPPSLGTAPGLICPIGDKVIYAVPGVPAEMREMVTSTVVPDLQRRSGEQATVRSRFLRVFGMAESKVAEVVAPRLAALEGTTTTIAFLANVSQGVRVRVTTRTTGPGANEEAEKILDAEEAELRALLGEAVVGTDEEGLEPVIGRLLSHAGLRVGVAESLTGGVVGARLTSVPGASGWFAGGIVSYGEDVKRRLLGVGPGPVVSEQAAKEMATGVCEALGCEIGLALTGVAGPTTEDDQPVGTVFVALAGLSGDEVYLQRLNLGSAGRELVRERAATYALDFLRRQLLARSRP